MSENAVVAWIKEQAIPIMTLDPQAPLDDLAPFEQMVGNASLVGLGEASHGAHEFFVMKHRLLRFLVEKMGFTMLAMEMSWMRAEPLNDYVLTGKGDVKALLKNNGHDIWYTQEILDLIEWMRAYNARQEQAHQVHFAGFDCGYQDRSSLEKIVQYFQAVDPEYSQHAAHLYDMIATQSSLPQAPELSVRQQIREAASQVCTRLSEHKNAYIARSSPAAFTSILQEAHIAEQMAQFFLSQGARYRTVAGRERMQQREHFMAENIAWLHERREAGRKLVVWAHNGHIASWGWWRHGPDPFEVPFTWMGRDLRQRYGEQYMPLGFSFYEGAHSAIPITKDIEILSHKRQPCSITPAIEGSSNALLRKVQGPYLLDLRSAPSGEVRDWFDQRHPTRTFGGGHVSDEGDYANSVLSECFDVLIEIERISPSQLLESE